MPKISWWLAATVLIAVVGLWFVTPFLVKAIVRQTLQERAWFGDVFGTVSALFSGLAFAGVVLAILLQREELSLQRQELKETREELKRSATAQEESQQALNKTIYAQTFKVALDILEAPEVIAARGYVYLAKDAYKLSIKTYQAHMVERAEKVTRTFESVATMIRRGVLPLEYMDNWCMPVTRTWNILEPFIRELRETRRDPYISRDFEWLVEQMKRFVPPEPTAS